MRRTETVVAYETSAPVITANTNLLRSVDCGPTGGVSYVVNTRSPAVAKIADRTGCQ